ncbi:hypothetical protein [Nitrincola tapanii]|uniref:Insulinase family protein n=1 Tax=Nitrincola tapanii TaxID=1708751 RepID=A0A5A9W120_9GAMM|nr:hypothetical protein [Nitrincola tapanii]KAA0874480.1 hypothetical protein E1H14_09435 [Nitrincola tapanii]
MSVSDYKPLFNRRYLYWLMWIVAIAIVLLNIPTAEKEDAGFTFYYLQEADLYGMQTPASDTVQMEWLLQLPPAFNREQRLLHAELQAKLQQIEADWLIRYNALSGHWEKIQRAETLGLRWRGNVSLSPERLQELSDELAESFQSQSIQDERWYAQAAAHIHLDLQSPENRLLAELGNWLQPAWQDQDLQWLRLYSAAERPAAAEALPAPQTHSTPHTLAPHSGEMQGYQNQRWWLIAWPLATHPSPQELALSRLAASRLQRYLEQETEIQHYRLLWQPNQRQGYLALILSLPESSDLSTEEWLEQLRHKIADSRLDEHSARLGGLEEATAARQALELTARFRWSLDSYPLFQDTLRTHSSDEIQAWLEALLTTPAAVHWVLNPY